MEILNHAEEKMKKAVAVLEEDLKTIRTGIAHASLLDHVQFEYYGSPTPINQVASVKVVEGRQLVIKPYDRGTLKDIERAIQTSDTSIAAFVVHRTLDRDDPLNSLTSIVRSYAYGIGSFSSR